MTGNIILIGFMGVGKGRTARMLAEKSGMFAVDCDDLIESFTNMRVKKIFARQGEPAFRELEYRVAEWLEKGVQQTIISTGGGFFKVPNLHSIGKVVFLHRDFSEILQSIQEHPNAKKKIKKRPLLKDFVRAEALYNERLPQYREVADLEVQMGDRSVDEVTEEILRRLSLFPHNAFS